MSQLTGVDSTSISSWTWLLSMKWTGSTHVEMSCCWHIHHTHIPLCDMLMRNIACNVSHLRFGWTPNSRAHIEMLLQNGSMCLNCKNYLLFYINHNYHYWTQCCYDTTRTLQHCISFCDGSGLYAFIYAFKTKLKKLQKLKISIFRKCWTNTITNCVK